MAPPNFVNNTSTMKDRQIITPIAVPSVFVITSVRPELRVGRNACRISIVRLVNSPMATAVVPGYLIARVNERYAKKQRPRGTNPAIFTPTSCQ
jgi:hypothetical protein